MISRYRVDTKFQETADSSERCDQMNAVRQKGNHGISNDINEIIF